MDIDSKSEWKRKYPSLAVFCVFILSVKSSQVMAAPTAAAPKLLQLQRPPSITGDGNSIKENGLGSPRRSFDSSSGSIRSDSSSIHPLKYTWVNRHLDIPDGRLFGVCVVHRGKEQATLQTTPPPTKKSHPSHRYVSCPPYLIPGRRFLGNLLAFSALLEINSLNDILVVPSSDYPNMGTSLASQGREMVRPSPQTSLCTSMGTTPPCSHWRRIQ